MPCSITTTYHRCVQELRPGLWHWRAPHPEWSPKSEWPEEVSSYAIDDGERLLLFDPNAVPEELLQRAGERETVIVLTAPWHERDTQSLLKRLDATVVAPPPDSAQDLMDKFGITREQAGDGSPDLNWLPADERLDHVDGVEAFGGREENDLVLWVESHRAVIAGDSIADFGRGLEIVPGWLREGVTREDVAARLRPLLDRPVELVLPAHGAPTDRGGLERALQA